MLLPHDPHELAAIVDRLHSNGWLPVPLEHRSKVPLPGIRWKDRRFTGQDFEKIAQRNGSVGIGLRLDNLVVLDIDADDEATADRLCTLAELIVGKTAAVRVGRHSRRAMFYRGIGRWKAQQKPLSEWQIVEVVWRRFQAEADLGRPKSRGGGQWTIRDVERKVRYALSPSQSAPINAAQAKGLWTLPRKCALKVLIDSDRRLTSADRKVAWAIIEAVGEERGLSYCSSTTLGRQTGLHPTTVRVSRRRLVELNYFEEIRKGGQNRSTRLRPNHRLVESVAAGNPIQAFSVPTPANNIST